MNNRRRIRPNGGTTAPNRFGGGPNTGLNARRQPNHPAWQTQGNMSPLKGNPLGGGGQQQGNQPNLAPWETDPLSQNAFALANKTYGNTAAYIGANREGLERHYGLNANGEPLGETSPYSLAMQLQRRRENERRGAVTGAGLNLYSGSTINHLRGADFRYGQDQAGLKEQFASELEKLRRQETEAEEAKEGAYQEGREGANERLGEEPLPIVPGGAKKNRKHRRRRRQGKD